MTGFDIVGDISDDGVFVLMLEGIIDILLWIMDKTHFLTRTWAIDIVLLTILVRLLMYPLNLKMNRSMKLMQKIQPEMKEIQEKYKGKPDVAQKEMMELYKKYGVNPFSSCLPMLVQMPVFIALFWALRDPRYYLRLPGFEIANFLGTKLTIPPLINNPFPEVALSHGVFDIFGLMHFPFVADRFLYLPTLWLVALYIATTIIQSRQMQSQSQASGSGANSMNFMLPMIILISFMFPTGLLIYFITSNVLQMGTYWRIQREIVLEEGEREETSQNGPDSVSSNKTSASQGGKGSGTLNKSVPSGKRKKK